ncbi:PREDICTED: chlorophyllase-2, chloroplastic [Prunus mume]|uniref:chlorophyllase n=1 Tax=Prunus mume TaxID=102107 RepID=A0ABM0NFZ4_PRUMU|nr:PREDICTED: chlorophyllase-2, chloroplastic [Prunus mume]
MLMTVMSSSTSSSSVASTAATNVVFEIGKYKVVLQRAEPETTCSTKSSNIPVPPPKPLLIGMPCEAGEFPLLLLLHGYLLSNSFYSQLIQHIASHGFIVVAPQLYTIAGPDSTGEIKSTAAITNWLSEGLQFLLPPHVQANLSKLALAGHSRGGKVSFALAFGQEGNTNRKFSALIGIDPVDGMDKGKQTPPPVLTYVPHSFDLDMAVMVIGSGLGEVKRNPLFPPCAPKGVNHEDFFNECQKPACYFVAKDYGHLDMLDDETKGIRGKSTYCVCKNGKSREPMRKFVGGVVVAFLQAYLEGDSSHLTAIKDGLDETVPVELQIVKFNL